MVIHALKASAANSDLMCTNHRFLIQRWFVRSSVQVPSALLSFCEFAAVSAFVPLLTVKCEELFSIRTGNLIVRSRS